MHISRFFLFYMISLSVFSCSAMENKQLTQDLSKQIIRSLPIFGRLDKGESGADIFFDIAAGTVNGLETIRQRCKNLSDSPTTQAVITNVQVGAKALGAHTYSMGVTLCGATHNLLKWAYDQRKQYQQNPLTFDKAVVKYNQHMYSMMYSELSASDKKECKQNIIDSLTTIKTDISTITELINIAKGITENNSSGNRTRIIDYVIADIASNKKITEKKAQDYLDIINEIAKFSKTEDGENNLADSISEPAIFVNDGEQLLSALEKAENPDNNVFSEFIQKYMSNDSTMQAVLENKKYQNTTQKLDGANQNIVANTNQDALLIEQLKTTISQIELRNTKMTQAAELKQAEIEQYKTNLSALTNEIKGHQQTLQQLTYEKTKLETEKQVLSQTINQQTDQLQQEQALKTQITQEKTALESRIQQLWSFITIGSGVITISAIAILVHYFKLHEQCMALFH
jgi:hypothetical protein